MFDAEILGMLRCPHAGKQLELADASFVEKLNRLLERGELRDRLGRPVTGRVDGGLVTSGGRFVYPIRGGIATLIAEEAMVVEEVGEEPAGAGAE